MPTIEIPAFWTFHQNCSCPFGSVRADQSPHMVLATEQQAWEDFYETKRERAKGEKDGVYVTGDSAFDIERWNAGHGHPDCTRVAALPVPQEGDTNA